MKPSTYNGEKYDFDPIEFVKEMEKKLKILKCPNKKKVELVVFCLEVQPMNGISRRRKEVLSCPRSNALLLF